MSSHQPPLESKSPSEERKLALITGGTSGIGLGMAEALAPRYDLALSYATQTDKAQKAVSELRTKFPEARIECYGRPLSGEKDCSELLEKVSGDFNADVSVLVNSAGRLRDGLFMSQNIGEHVALMEEHVPQSVWADYQLKLHNSSPL